MDRINEVWYDDDDYDRDRKDARLFGLVQTDVLLKVAIGLLLLAGLFKLIRYLDYNI